MFSSLNLLPKMIGREEEQSRTGFWLYLQMLLKCLLRCTIQFREIGYLSKLVNFSFIWNIHYKKCPCINFPAKHTRKQRDRSTEAVQPIMSHKISFVSTMLFAPRRLAWRFICSLSWGRFVFWAKSCFPPVTSLDVFRRSHWLVSAESWCTVIFWQCDLGKSTWLYKKNRNLLRWAYLFACPHKYDYVFFPFSLPPTLL